MLSTALSTIFYYIILPAILLKILVKWTYKMCNTKVCLVGKTAVVTGGNKGIGFQTSLALASRGCKVFIACRSNAEEVVKKIKEMTRNDNVFYRKLDLSSLKSIRAFSKQLHEELDHIDILINNAGLGGDVNEVTEDGLDYVMCTNLFGPFLLTHLLIDLLRCSQHSRVLFVSSIMIYAGHLTVANLNDAIDTTNAIKALGSYSRSKTGLAVVAVEMAERLKQYSNVKVNCIHPGNVRTEIFDKLDLLNMPPGELIMSWLFRYVLVKYYFRTPEEGAQRTIKYTVSNGCRDITGHVDTGFNWILGLPRCLKDVEYRKSIWTAIEGLVKMDESEKLK